MEIDSHVGFRFRPTNEEIILLLKKKRLDPGFSVHTVKEIDFYKFDPWDLPRHAGIQCKEPIWYFYCKSSNSKRARRGTISGYWKITGRGSEMKAKNGKDVIGSKKILSFYPHGRISKEAKTEWVMHEIHVKDKDPLDKEDFVMCRLERKQGNKPRRSTSDEGESSQHSDVAENTSPKSVLPPNQQLFSNKKNVGEKTFLLSHNLKSQLQPNQCSNDHNALVNDSLQLQPNQCFNGDSALDSGSLQLQRNQCFNGDSALDSGSLQLQPNQCFNGNIALDNDSLQLQPNQFSDGHNPLDNDSLQLQPNQCFNGDSALDDDSLQLQPNQCFNSDSALDGDSLQLQPNQCFNGNNSLDNDSLQLQPNQFSDGYNPLDNDSLQLQPNQFDGYDPVDNDSFSGMQSTIDPEQGSAHSNAPNDCFYLLNSQCDSEQVGNPINSQRGFQNEYSLAETEQTRSPEFKSKSDGGEEAGQTFTPEFNSSMSDGRVHVADGSEADTESFIAWANTVFEY